MRVFLFWIAAAVFVAASHFELDGRSATACAAACIASVAAAAYAYTRFCGRPIGITHALGVGIAWLVLAIAGEIAMTSWTGRGWYALLGTPEHPLVRNVFLFVWIFMPVLFVREEMTA